MKLYKTKNEKLCALFLAALLIVSCQTGGGSPDPVVPKKTEKGLKYCHNLVIDNSGSVGEKAFQRVRSYCGSYLATKVKAGDSVNIFTFTDWINLVDSSQVAEEKDKQEILAAIENLDLVLSTAEHKVHTVFVEMIKGMKEYLESHAPPDQEIVILVFSDGKSAPPPGYGRDIPFRQVGEKVIKEKGFYIALIGEKDLAFSDLASRPLASRTSRLEEASMILEELKGIVYPPIRPTLDSLELEAKPPFLSLIGLSETTKAKVRTGWQSLSPAIRLVKVKEVKAELAGRELSVTLPTGGLLFQARGSTALPLELRLPLLSPGMHPGTLHFSFGPRVHAVRADFPLTVKYLSWWQAWRLWVIGLPAGVALSFFVLEGFRFRRRVRPIYLSMNGEQVQELRRGHAVAIGGLTGFSLPNLAHPVGEILYQGKGKFQLSPHSNQSISLEMNGIPITARVPFPLGSQVVIKGQSFEETVCFQEIKRTGKKVNGGESGFSGEMLGQEGLLSDDLLQ